MPSRRRIAPNSRPRATCRPRPRVSPLLVGTAAAAPDATLRLRRGAPQSRGILFAPWSGAPVCVFLVCARTGGRASAFRKRQARRRDAEKALTAERPRGVAAAASATDRHGAPAVWGQLAHGGEQC